MKPITITISAPVGSGKSLLGLAITKALNDFDIPVKLFDESQEVTMRFTKGTQPLNMIKELFKKQQVEVEIYITKL